MNTPETPSTPEPLEGADAVNETPASEQHQKRPDDTTPRGNPEIDEEALKKSEESLGRVQPY